MYCFREMVNRIDPLSYNNNILDERVMITKSLFKSGYREVEAVHLSALPNTLPSRPVPILFPLPLYMFYAVRTPRPNILTRQ